MEWLIILAVMSLYSTSLMMCYSDSTRNSWYYPIFSLGFSLIVSTLWVTGVRYLDNKDRIFFFSLCWEFSVIFIDYTIPLVFFGLNVNKYVVMGSFVVAMGLTIMTLNMKG
jgi:hypothetical protein